MCSTRTIYLSCFVCVLLLFCITLYFRSFFVFFFPKKKYCSRFVTKKSKCRKIRFVSIGRHQWHLPRHSWHRYFPFAASRFISLDICHRNLASSSIIHCQTSNELVTSLHDRMREREISVTRTHKCTEPMFQTRALTQWRIWCSIKLI